MPRKLPWLNKGVGSGKKQTKQPIKLAPKSRITTNIDDDFFVDPTESGEDEWSRKKEPIERTRVPSSSPPAVDSQPPETEYMDKGVDRFDLRDDEWMMVEDELLQTAKLFTRHLHLAEYKRMKADIEEKRNNSDEIISEIARPVVANAKLSVEGQFKLKAEEQAKAQRAIRENLSDTDDENESNIRRPLITKKTSSRHYEPAPRASDNSSGTDSEDLDAPQRPTKVNGNIRKPVSAPSQHASGTTAMSSVKVYTKTVKTSSAGPVPKAASTSLTKPNIVPEPQFTKPALPANARARARARPTRRTLLDSWDDFVPNTASRAETDPSPVIKSPPATKLRPLTKTPLVSSPVKSSIPAMKKPAARSINLLDDFDTPKRDDAPRSKETTDRLAKRKAERDKDAKSKARKADLDDIPTFMF